VILDPAGDQNPELGGSRAEFQLYNQLSVVLQLFSFTLLLIKQQS